MIRTPQQKASSKQSNPQQQRAYPSAGGTSPLVLSFVQKLVENSPPNDSLIQSLKEMPSRTIQEIYIQLQKVFSNTTQLPLVKLSIIHFFQHTQEIQMLLDPTMDYADRFIGNMSAQRWQRALIFKAVSSLSTTIERSLSIPNSSSSSSSASMIRSGTLFLMKTIDNISSSDPEVFEVSKEVLLKLIKKVPSFSHIYLQCIPMPFLLIFLPEMTEDSHVISQVVSIYLKILKTYSENSQSPEPNNEDQFGNNYGANEEDEKDISPVLESISNFVKNLKIFPRQLFYALLELLPNFRKQNYENENSSYNQQTLIINYGTCFQIFILISELVDYLQPAQVRMIADLAIEYILQEKENIISPLKMLSALRVTDERLESINPIDVESATYLLSVYPRPTEDNPEGADKAIEIIRKFVDQPFSIYFCSLLLKHLIAFVPYLSEEAHSIIIEVLLPNLTKQGFQHQEEVALFLSSISIELSSLYVYYCHSYSEDVPICPKLKAASLSLHYLAGVQPASQFASIALSESYECGRSLFLIGEYSEIAKLWKNDESTEAYRIFSSGELFYQLNDHSQAAEKFKSAAESFRLSPFPHDFHVFYCLARHYYESICFQTELMSISPAFTPISEPLSNNICDINELTDILKKLGNSSLLLHPEIDLVSRNYIEKFIETAQNMIAAIDQSPSQFSAIINQHNIIPPPAFLSVTQPVTIEDLQIAQPDIEISAASSRTRQFFVELIGKVKNESKLTDFKVMCEVVINIRGNPFSVHSQEIVENEYNEFSVDFPIVAQDQPEHESTHHMPVTVTFTAVFKDASKYLIEYSTKYIIIHER